MQEIAEVLVERGHLTPTEILPELRAATLRGATSHKEPLNPRDLLEKDGRAGLIRVLLRAVRGRPLRAQGWLRPGGTSDASPRGDEDSAGRTAVRSR